MGQRSVIKEKAGQTFKNEGFQSINFHFRLLHIQE